MSQIIKPETIDFKNLVENNSKNIQSQFHSQLVTKLNENFTNDEQKWYIANLYIYLNYHPTNEFPINLENVWKMIGFSHKKNAKRTLENNFTENEDYKTTVLPREHGQFQTETVMLNVDTFKNLCMITKTEKGKQIRKYYVKLENIMNTLVNDQRIEYENQQNLLKLQLQSQEEINKKLQQEKAMEKHNLLLRKFGDIGDIVYIIKVKTFTENKYIIKIGESRRGIKDRYREHRQKYPEAEILDCFPVQRCKDFENAIHENFRTNKVEDLPGHEKEKELFLIGENLSYSTLIKYIDQNIKNYDSNNHQHTIQLKKLNNTQLRLMNKNAEIGVVDTDKIIESNQKIHNRLDSLEDCIQNLKDQIIAIGTRTNTSMFNQPLGTFGPRLQKINPESLELIQVYESVTDLIKSDLSIKRSSINKAVVQNTIYKNFRWCLVDRDLDPNVVGEIAPTVVPRPQFIGYIAKLNSTKTEILNIYLDRKSAAILNNYPSHASLDTVVKKGNLSNGHYYVLYEEVSEEIRNNFDTPILYKNGVGKYDLEHKLVQEFTSKFNCVSTDTISEKSLNKALKLNLPFNDFYYKEIGSKLSML